MKLWTIAWFELRMLTRTRAVLLNLFLLPMVLIFILGNALSSNFKDEAEASVEQARVLIVEPNTGGAVQGELEVGLGLREFLNSPEIKQRMRIEKTVSREEAVEALTRGEADFGVIIPSDFEERVTGEGSAVGAHSRKRQHEKLRRPDDLPCLFG
ncbi:ABC transporter permease [Paenibacillus sp. FSL W8-0186]|uniref:ABC transporter permease n=1 Tax=Paenibacillus sp. FSL W8-0186 TaxID=2921709 RepID=UPI0030D0A4EF